MRKLLIFLLFAPLVLPAYPQNHGRPHGGGSCHADFSSNPDPIDSMTIHFFDHSTGNITNWTWSFGDGGVSTLKDPVHHYATGGHYWVCLTVYDSVSSCHEELCQQITVHEPGKCIADYIYSVTPPNPEEVHFEDRSTGNVNAWHWNFGDGTTSDDRNPVHTFAASGKYPVCLTAYRQGSACNDTKCDTVEISPDEPCKAMFTVRLDTLNPEPNTFIFKDQSAGHPSEFFWRFDDGATYTTPDVTHRFQSGGQHEVCLRVIKRKHGNIQCADSVCQQVTTANYFDLGGHLFAGTYPINNPVSTGDTGIAILFRMDGSRMIPFDTTRVTDLGYYAFPRILNGRYALSVRLTPGSANYPGYLPGYYPEALLWTEAGMLDLTNGNSYSADIHMSPVKATQQGTAIVRGRVSLSNPKDSVMPVPGAEIILFNGQMEPARFTFTGADGKFEITDLPFGAYRAYVEYPGSYSRMTAVWLDSTVTLIDDLLLELFDHDVTFIHELAGSRVAVSNPFPNPARGQVGFLARMQDSEILGVTIQTLAGVIRWSGSFALPAGETLVRLPLSSLEPGAYLLSVSGKEGHIIVVKKLLTY